MEARLRQTYQGLVDHLEEPIREIVPAIWDLPFVADTRHTCSGHIVVLEHMGVRYTAKLNDATLPRFWYPHRATLQIDFSLDPRYAEERDNFRAALKNVEVSFGQRSLYFDSINEQEGPSYDTLVARAFRRQITNPEFVLSCSYDASVEDQPQTLAYVQETETLLIKFWEGVADVVRQYNRNANIGSIAGKDFRRSISWDVWKSVFGKRFE